MDLSDFETSKIADQGSVMPVRNPKDGSPLVNPDGSPMTVTVYGTDGQRFQQARMRKINMRLKMRKTKVTGEELDSEALDVLIAATAAWHVTFDGKLAEFTPDNVRVAYVKFPWLRRQVDEWMADEANFTPA